MHKIDLKLFVTLSGYLPENADNYAVAEDKTVGGLITDLKLPAELVKLIFVNGKRQEASYLLQNGDRVGIFPPVGGG